MCALALHLPADFPLGPPNSISQMVQFCYNSQKQTSDEESIVIELKGFPGVD